MAYNWGGGDSAALTPDQLSVLEHLSYDDVGDILSSNAAFKTTVDSMHLGDQHTMTSGLQNVFFRNDSTNINWYPMWGGILDQSVVSNQDASGLIQPSARVYGNALVQRDVAGPAHANAVMNARFPVTAADNRSTHAASVMLGETVVVGDKIRAVVRSANGITGVPHISYQQKVSNLSGVAGDLIKLWFDHPMDLLAGDTVTQILSITKPGAAERDLIVRQSAGSTSVPFLRTWSRTFEDKDIAFIKDIRGMTGQADIRHTDNNVGNWILARDGNILMNRAGDDIQWDLTD